jgi:hypothetical protein
LTVSRTVAGGDLASGVVMNDDAARPVRIGWKEYVALPEWHLRRLRAKVDTGAWTSVLDVADYELAEEAGGLLVARLRLALSRKHPERVRLVEVPVLRLVVVRNTGGTLEERPLLETTLCLGPVCKRIRLTVTNRSHMRHRMLMGRLALAGDFVVDVSQKYLMRRTPE